MGSGVAWIIGARGGLQFCRPQKVVRCLICPLYHPIFIVFTTILPLSPHFCRPLATPLLGTIYLHTSPPHHLSNDQNALPLACFVVPVSPFYCADSKLFSLCGP